MIVVQSGSYVNILETDNRVMIERLHNKRTQLNTNPMKLLNWDHRACS